MNDYADFAAFQKHMAGTTRAVVERGDAVPGVDHKAKVVNLRYTSGADTLEADYVPSYTGAGSQRVRTDSVWPLRKVNGQWPYLPDGIVRDSSHSQQGRTGVLEKNGASLRHQPGCMGYLLTSVKDDVYAFLNPLPDPQYMVLTVPGKLTIKADGKLGLARIVVHPKANTLVVDYALKPDQHTPDMASALYAFGYGAAPAAVLNGKPMGSLAAVTLDNQKAWRMPLEEEKQAPAEAETIRRYSEATSLQAAGLSAQNKEEAFLRYDKGEPPLMSLPRSGAWNFQRYWPMPCHFEAVLPGGIRVSADGALHLMQLAIDAREGSILCAYPPSWPVDDPVDKAEAMLVFGMEKPPAVTLQGVRYAGEIPSLQVNGERAWVIPLYGKDAAAVATAAAARYTRAMEALQKAEER